MYNVIQENGDTYKVNSEHILTLSSQKNNIFDIPIKKFLSIDDLLKKNIYGVHGNCVKWETQTVPYDPYLFGLWLGDSILDNISNKDDDQLKFSKLAIDYGVDIIIGSHPHVVQNISIYKNKPIFFSLGNFVFHGFAQQDDTLDIYDPKETSRGWVL
jgi:hypothetical protein